MLLMGFGKFAEITLCHTKFESIENGEKLAEITADDFKQLDNLISSFFLEALYFFIVSKTTNLKMGIDKQPM